MTRPSACAAAPQGSDSGAIITGWLIKLVIVLAVVGVVAIDGISVLSARMQLQDATVSAARSTSEALQRSRNRNLIVLEADRSLANLHPENRLDPTTIVVSPDYTVTLSASRTAATLVLGKIGPLEKYATVHATGSARAT